MAEAGIKLGRFNQNVTMKVDLMLTREFRVRACLATRLIWLAAWILGCELEVNKEGRN